MANSLECVCMFFGYIALLPALKCVFCVLAFLPYYLLVLLTHKVARPEARHSVFLAESLDHLDEIAFRDFVITVEVLNEKLFNIVSIIDLDVESVSKMQS